MSSHADILNSLITQLHGFERHIATLTRSNEARLIATGVHMRDSAAQMLSGSDDPDKPIRQNGSFFPPRSLSRRS
jgi:hypothetical protein